MAEDMQIGSREEAWQAVTVLLEKDFTLASVNTPITSKATPTIRTGLHTCDLGKYVHIPQKAQLRRLVQ